MRPTTAAAFVCCGLALVPPGAPRHLAAATHTTGRPAASAGRHQASPPVRPPTRFAGKLEACRIPNVDGEMWCGTYEVPEDRTAGSRSARRIRLNLVVMPATSDAAAPDPVVYLAGGGVIPATRYAGMFARNFPSLRQSREIVLVDQRGTGQSNALACPGLTPGPPRPETQARLLDELRQCRAALDARADLRHYGTEQAVDDLADVLWWLGYGQVNLYGMSYGTKAAQVFLARHPGRVRSMALHGTMALDAPMWLDLAGSAQRSFEKVAGLCAADPACQAAHGDIRTKLDAALAALARRAVELQAEDATGAMVTVRIDDRTVRDMLNALLTSARGIRDIPFIVHELSEGRYQTLATILAQESNAPPSPIPRGLFLTLLCGESMPQVDRGAIEATTSGTFVGDFPLRHQLAQCSVWPVPGAPGRLYEPVRSNVPVLLLTGELDNTTPPAYAERVAATMPRARVIRLPGRSHNDGDPCVTSLIQGFIIAGDHAALDPACGEQSGRLTFRQ